MSYLEELLPEFKKGIKIRRKPWNEGKYIKLKGLYARDEYGNGYFLEPDELAADDWEFYQEPINWQYIIGHQCLCFFWDEWFDSACIGVLGEIYEKCDLKFVLRDKSGNQSQFRHCRPVRRDEVTFYEEKKDGNI